MTAQAERHLTIAGLNTTVIGSEDAPLTLVLLHGYAMRPADLAPFAHSLGIPALFLFPQGPHTSPMGGYAWWEVDLNAREAALNDGPRDLAEDSPRGLPQARERLGEFLCAVAARYPVTPKQALGGFSQGGMLSLDYVLRGSRPVDALALMSASRIALSEWLPQRTRLCDFPVFVSHGTTDGDLAFSAGERLRDFVLESSARLTWVPFEGGHEIPLVVWRGLRKFLTTLLK
jgi:phospholipase/carboxylesterase